MSIPLAAVATQFLERSGIAKSTCRSYELTLMPLLQEYGRCPSEILVRQTLSEYLNGLTHLSYTTHHRHQAIVQALFNFAVEKGYLQANPIARLRRRKPDQDLGEHASDQVIRYLSPEQLCILYQAVASDWRMNALVRLLHCSGARISEVLAMDLQGMDLANREFQVVGKGNKQRWCFYSEDAAQMLEKYLKYYRHLDCPALFTAQQRLTGQSSRLSYQTVHKYWTALTKPHSELKGARIHDLRCAIPLRLSGLD